MIRLDGWCEVGLGKQKDGCGGHYKRDNELKIGRSGKSWGIYIDNRFMQPFLLGSCVLSDHPPTLCWRVTW